VRMRLEVHLPPSAVGDVRVALGRSEVRVAEHLLNRAKVGAAFEQVRRERMAEEMGVNACQLEPGPVRELAQDQECAGARQGSAASVQEELRPVTTVEMRPTEGEVPAHGLCCRPPERYQALLVSLAQHPYDPLLESDATLLESDRLGHAQAGAVEELHERAIAERSWGRAGRRVDKALGLGRRKRAG